MYQLSMCVDESREIHVTGLLVAQSLSFPLRMDYHSFTSIFGNSKKGMSRPLFYYTTFNPACQIYFPAYSHISHKIA